jgi:hypothetical protein
MASAYAVFLAKIFGCAGVDVEIGKPEEDDLGAVFETDLDERVLTRLTGNHGVDATRAADPAAMHIGEIRRLRTRLANGDRAAHEHLRAIVQVRAPTNDGADRERLRDVHGAADTHVRIKVRETMDLPGEDAVVAGLASDETAVADLVAALREAGVELHAIRIGAAEPSRADAIAVAHGVRTGVDLEDPLAGAPGLGDETGHRLRVDRGGMIGAIVGAVIGVVLGLLPAGRFLSTFPDEAPLIDGLLFFVAGGISGAVLGGAFGLQRSTHAGFRLVDGMAEGSIALLVTCPPAQSAAVQAVMDAHRATDVVVIG